jgi:hypothetical protein
VQSLTPCQHGPDVGSADHPVSRRTPHSWGARTPASGVCLQPTMLNDARAKGNRTCIRAKPFAEIMRLAGNLPGRHASTCRSTSWARGGRDQGPASRVPGRRWAVERWRAGSIACRPLLHAAVARHENVGALPLGESLYGESAIGEAGFGKRPTPYACCRREAGDCARFHAPAPRRDRQGPGPVRHGPSTAGARQRRLGQGVSRTPWGRRPRAGTVSKCTGAGSRLSPG